MNKYELALVLSGKLEEEEKATALRKTQGYITRFNGTVMNVDDWDKKRFAYGIQKMKRGFYHFTKFESKDASTPNRPKTSLRIFEPVMRYLTVRDEVVEQSAQEAAE